MGIQISSRKRSELLHCNLETAENPKVTSIEMHNLENSADPQPTIDTK